MSTHDPHETGAFNQEPESFHGGRVALVGFVTLVIFALAVVWSTRIWQSRTRDNEPTGKPAIATELGKREIGIVDQVPFEQHHDAAELRKAKLERLGSYGYVDEKTGAVHIPIEQAYELVLKEKK